MLTGALRCSLPKGGENMLKNYKMPNGHTYQYEEGEQPECAVEVKVVEPSDKAVKKPANKSRKVVKK